MRGRPLVVMASVGIAVLAWASPVMAKGPDQATITGPGLDAPIVVAGYGEPGAGNALGELADGSGLFLMMFGTAGTGQSVLSEAPAGALGPKFAIDYRVPDGSPTGFIVRQDLYPLASRGPVTYTEGGQTAFGMTIVGGWYETPAGFRGLLERLGVPSTPDAVLAPPAAQPQPEPDRSPSSRTAPWVPIAAATLVLLLLVVAGVLFGRRRSRAVGGHAPVGQRG